MARPALAPATLAAPRPATSACARRTCTAPTRCPTTRAERADDRARRRLQRSERRSRPESLRRRIRPARMHERQRLLHAGQPERRKPRRCRSRKRSGELEAARGGSAGERKEAERATGWDGRDLARHRDRARRLPELQHRARRGRTSAYANLEAAEHSAGRARRERDLELLGRARGRRDGRSRESEPVQPSRRRDHRLGRRRRLPRLGRRNSAERGFAEFPPPRRTSSPSAARA